MSGKATKRASQGGAWSQDVGGRGAMFPECTSVEKSGAVCMWEFPRVREPERCPPRRV